MLFLLLLPLSWESMDSGLRPEAEVCVHLSLPDPFLLPLHLCSSPNSYLQELSACVGNGRAESEAALSQEWEGRENYLLLTWGSGLCPGPAATLEPWEVKRALQKHATLVFLFLYTYFPVLNLQSRWRKWPGPVTASSDPSSHGRSHTELCQQVALAAGYSQSLSPELTAAFGFLQHKMDDIYANPPSLCSLCCLLTPLVFPRAFRCALKLAVLQFSAGQ